MPPEQKRRGVGFRRLILFLYEHSLSSVRVKEEVFCYAGMVVAMIFKYPYLAFICGSRPSEVDSLYVGFSNERAGCQARSSRSYLVIYRCRSVRVLLLGFD